MIHAHKENNCIKKTTINVLIYVVYIMYTCIALGVYNVYYNIISKGLSNSPEI